MPLASILASKYRTHYVLVERSCACAVETLGSIAKIVPLYFQGICPQNACTVSSQGYLPMAPPLELETTIRRVLPGIYHCCHYCCWGYRTSARRSLYPGWCPSCARNRPCRGSSWLSSHPKYRNIAPHTERPVSPALPATHDMETPPFHPNLQFRSWGVFFSNPVYLLPVACTINSVSITAVLLLCTILGADQLVLAEVGMLLHPVPPQ